MCKQWKAIIGRVTRGEVGEVVAELASDRLNKLLNQLMLNVPRISFKVARNDERRDA